MRSWLVYSPSKRSAFCICCLLFSRFDNQSSLEQESGFKQWKALERMSVQENSKNHRQCFTQWKEMEISLLTNRGIIDAELQEETQRESQKWCDILKRLLHCIKYLAIQNLALRGHRESLQPDFKRTHKICGEPSWIHFISFTENTERVYSQHGIYCSS